jgi:2-keto-4-pentenoate hydratase
MSCTYQDLARRLRAAYTTGPVAPLRDGLEPLDARGAYEVQSINTALWKFQGRRIVGCKIGLTAKAVQSQLGVDQPDYGVLFDDMRIDDAGELHLGHLIQPRIEAEIAFILRSDLTDPNLSQDDLLAAVDYAVAALEIVDSRIENWNIGLADTIADNASSALFVLGRQRTPADGFDPFACAMNLYANGAVVSKGEGRLCLGSPFISALWLARKMAGVGRPLRARDVILTGALGPMVALSADTRYRAEIDGLGSVEVTAGR